MPTTKNYKVGLVLFEGFELLDVFGPVEMLGMHPDHFEIITVAEHSGWVVSAQGPASRIDWTFEMNRSVSTSMTSTEESLR